jgi:hypothetical protein
MGPGMRREYVAAWSERRRVLRLAQLLTITSENVDQYARP